MTSGVALKGVRTVTAPRLSLERHHVATMACMIGLVVSVIACAVSGIDPDIGVIAFGFGALLALIDPKFGALAFPKIDWSTVFMVGGIVTFVGVLQKMGSVDLLGHAAMNVGTPLVAALLICAIAGLVSAFASTTGILAAVVPLAVPLASSGDIRRLGADLRAGRMRLDRRRVAVLHDRGDIDCLGCRGRAGPIESVIDAMGNVDGRRRSGRPRASPRDPEQTCSVRL